MARRLLLPAALAAWMCAGPCLAQAPPAVPGAERPMQAPGTSERRSGGEAGEYAGAEPAGARALDAMERLRGELRTLTALRDAQAALLEWNRERAKTGRAPAALPAALCRDAAMEPWCALLPATFAGALQGEAHDGD